MPAVSTISVRTDDGHAQDGDIRSPQNGYMDHVPHTLAPCTRTQHVLFMGLHVLGDHVSIRSPAWLPPNVVYISKDISLILILFLDLMSLCGCNTSR